MKNIIYNMPHIGDILAIPFFILLFYYFYKIKNKTVIEYILYMFSFFGVLLDVIFTYLYFTKKYSGKAQ
jgi:hypothetical protein